MGISDIFRVFRDQSNTRIIWLKKDRFNWFGQHNPHREYSDESEIAKCLQKPDEIRLDACYPNRRCLYRDFTRANGITVTRKCVVEYKGKNMTKRGKLITTYYAQPKKSEKVI